MVSFPLRETMFSNLLQKTDEYLMGITGKVNQLMMNDNFSLQGNDQEGLETLVAHVIGQ